MRPVPPSIWLSLGYLLLLAATSPPVAGQGRYLTTDGFLREAFPDGAAEPHAVSMTAPLRAAIEKILGHAFEPRRVRYWAEGARTAWILDEIGKERPITIGVTVDGGKLETVRILEFRESRGSEVRYRFFTRQFENAGLGRDGHLDRRIDGITGATLSVAAVTRVARVALVLHQHVLSS